MPAPLRIAVIGCGYITQAEHVPALLSLLPEVEVVATADPELARAAAVAAPFRARHYASLTEVLASEAFDAILLCTRATTHLALLTQAAEAGKHILMEKPIAYSLAEARQAIAVIQRSGVRCMLAYHRRYDDDCRWVRTALAECAIGEVRAAVSLCRLALPSHYRAYAPMTKRSPAPSTQDLGDDWLTENSIHHLNVLRYWLGDAVRVHSALYRASDHNVGIVTLEFPGHVIVSHHQLRGMDCGEEITLYGTRGNLRVELWFPHRPYRFPRITRFTLDPPRWEEIAIPRISPYTNELAHFLRFLRGESGNDSSIEDSYLDLQILCEIRDRAMYLE
ncbi:MAG: Gfo/Idh/MocA family oxidoreductase [Betaproteobacteria bacterium]